MSFRKSSPAPLKRSESFWLAIPAPWILRLSFALVLLTALVTPFVLAAHEIFWIMIPLLLAAIGLWIARHDGFFSAGAMPVPSAGALASAAPVVSAEQDNAQLMAELNQLRHVQAQLLQAKQEAEAATMAKGEFLATMSHEIRTPLNGIIPLLDILLTSKLSPDQLDYLQTAYKSARELLRIVDDILDYSKIEAKKLDLEIVGLNLRELTDSVVHLLSTSAQAKGLKLSVQIDPAVRLAVRGDPVRLRQVLTNLVSNAIKFTNRGAVVIQISRRGETGSHHEVMFVVKDTGIGIAPESAARLFQPFSQADASTTRMHGGTGLGLIICKRIVELMNGKIGVKSELGRGSVFWFQIPLQKALGDVSEAKRDVNGSRALVLCAEASLMRRLNAYFSSWGVSFLQTTNVADTLAKLRSAVSMGERWAYDLLIVDLATLRGSSVALVRNIAREPNLDKVRFLLLAGEQEVPAEISGEPRLQVLPGQFAEGQLREAMQKLLGVGDHRGNPAGLPPTEQTIPEVQILEPSTPPRPITGHVLLVEDNPVNSQVAQRLIKLIGLSCTLVENGKAALDCLEQRQFDAVLMDCQMPVMDGYTATRMQRSREAEGRRARIPIIAMTANAMAGDREKCLNAGMDDYLSKPLNRVLLEQTLRNWISAKAPSESEPTSVVPAIRVPAVRVVEEARVVLDFEVVRDLVEVMGNEFNDLVRVYLEDTPQKLMQLEQAAQQNDIQGLVAPSHSLKSTSANLGALGLSEIAKSIEQGARRGTLTQPLVLTNQLNAEYQRVSDALKQLLQASGG